jgi:hypothetical protein
MIVDSESDLNALFACIQGRKTLLVPILADPLLHAAVNKVTCIYVYTEDAIERIVPIQHTEQLRGFTEHVSAILSYWRISLFMTKSNGFK